MNDGAKRARLTRLVEVLLAGERRRMLTFLAVGVINTVVGYGLFAALFLTTQSYRVAAVVAYVLGTLFNFFSTGRLVFKSSRASALLPFIAGYLVILGANLLLLELLVGLGMNALIAQAVSLPLLVVASYLINSRLVFRQQL